VIGDTELSAFGADATVLRDVVTDVWPRPLPEADPLRPGANGRAQAVADVSWSTTTTATVSNSNHPSVSLPSRTCTSPGAWTEDFAALAEAGQPPVADIGADIGGDIGGGDARHRRARPDLPRAGFPGLAAITREDVTPSPGARLARGPPRPGPVLRR